MKITTWMMGAGAILALASCKESTTGTAKAPAAEAGGEAAQPKDAGHVLARKNDLPPEGTSSTRESVQQMGESKLTIDAGGQQMEGAMSRKDVEVKKLEGLGSGKVRMTLVSKKSEGAMTINGQDQPLPAEPEPLEGVPVVIELEDGKWSAVLESGETPDAAQQKKLKTLEDGFNTDEDFAMYGDQARKPGDKWQVDPSKLSSLGDAGDLSGTYELEFVEVKDHEGVSCAVIKGVFDLTGKVPSNGGQDLAMQFKGESLVHRSLADLTDIEQKISGTMTVEGEAGPGVKMQVVGPMSISAKMTLEKK
jgi:hypothetical protein